MISDLDRSLVPSFATLRKYRDPSDRSRSLIVSHFRISLRWPIHIINPDDETKLSCYTSHRRSTTVSLETYPSITGMSNIKDVPMVMEQFSLIFQGMAWCANARTDNQNIRSMS